MFYDFIEASVGIAFKDNPMEHKRCSCLCFDLRDNSLWSHPPFSHKSTGFAPKIQIGDKITCIFSPTDRTLTFKVNDTPISDTPSFTGIPLDLPLYPYIESFNNFSCEFDLPVC
jgi:hypothetical protein